MAGRQSTAQKNGLTSSQQLVKLDLEVWTQGLATDIIAVLPKARKAIALAESLGQPEAVYRSMIILARYEAVKRRRATARELLNKAMPTAILKEDWVSRALAERTYYVIERDESDWEAALQHLFNASECNRQNGKLDHLVQSSLATHYKDLGLYPEALEILYEVIERLQYKQAKFNRLDLRLEEAKIWLIISYVYHHLRDWEHFADAHNKAYDIFEAVGDRDGIMCSQIGFGMLAIQAKDYEGAIEIYQNLLGMQGEEVDPPNFVKTLNNMVWCYCALGQADLAMQCSERSLALARKTKIPHLICFSMISHGKSHMAGGSYNEAATTLKHALDFALEHGAQPAALDACQNLVKCYSNLDDEQMLQQYRTQAKEMHEAQRGTQIHKKVTVLQMRFELMQSRRSDELLRMQNSELQHEVKELNSQLVKMAALVTQKDESLKALKREVGELARAAGESSQALVGTLSAAFDKYLNKDSAWQHFDQMFTSVHGDFLQILAERWPQLTPTEMKICALIRLDLSSNQMAETLCLSLHTVNTHRQRIRKKLALAKGHNLTTFLHKL